MAENTISRTTAARYLMAATGNCIWSDDGKCVERVDMIGGTFLTYDELGNVNGFMNLSNALDFLGFPKRFRSEVFADA